MKKKTDKKSKEVGKKGQTDLKSWKNSGDLSSMMENNNADKHNKSSSKLKSPPKSQQETQCIQVNDKSQKSKWWQFPSLRKSQEEGLESTLKKSESESGKFPAQNETGSDETPSWYVVEPVRYVESLCGQEQEVWILSISKKLSL